MREIKSVDCCSSKCIHSIILSRRGISGQPKNPSTCIFEQQPLSTRLWTLTRCISDSLLLRYISSQLISRLAMYIFSLQYLVVRTLSRWMDFEALELIDSHWLLFYLHGLSVCAS
uniref:Uncharacterized protein n=1 Tax=Acrobeloides nanus TaxID=290746 RepID=A0A914CH91_9BILA